MKKCDYCKKDGVSCIDHVDAEHCPNSLPFYEKFRPEKKRKTVEKLHKKTKLTLVELELLKAGGGKGDHIKYSANGEVSLELIRRLSIAKKKSPKYVLYCDQLGRRLYVADKELAGLDRDTMPLTFAKQEALYFLDGFDEPFIKQKYFQEKTGFYFQTLNIY